MRDKRIQLIYFSLAGSEVKQVNLGWKKIIGAVSLLFTVLLVIVSIVLSIFTDVFHNWQITNLSRANSQLGDYLTTMNKKIDNIENTIFYLEKNDEDLRIFVDLPRINSDVRKLGIGGHADQTFGQLSSVSGEDKELAIKTQRVIENLSQRVKLALESRKKLIKNFAMISPNLNTLLPFVLFQTHELPAISHTVEIRLQINRCFMKDGIYPLPEAQTFWLLQMAKSLKLKIDTPQTQVMENTSKSIMAMA